MSPSETPHQRMQELILLRDCFSVTAAFSRSAEFARCFLFSYCFWHGFCGLSAKSPAYASPRCTALECRVSRGSNSPMRSPVFLIHSTCPKKRCKHVPVLSMVVSTKTLRHSLSQGSFLAAFARMSRRQRQGLLGVSSDRHNAGLLWFFAWLISSFSSH